MNRRLVALNLVLVVIAGWLGWMIRENWLEAERRQNDLLRRRAAVKTASPAAPAPATGPAATPASVSAANFFDVAARTLFSKDRNPDVVIETPPPPPPAPPPPPTPYLYGVMDVGEGPTAFMAPRGGSQKAFKVGDQIAQYKLVAIKEDSLVLQWEDKTFEKKFEELKDRSGGTQNQAQNDAPAAAPNVPPPPKPREVKSDAAPGEDVGGDMRACNAGDTSPAGTISGGYRKVIRGGPFGNRCFWEPVR
ncbi:MAG: hypothetical protein K2Q23_04485 [Bryobacteraceae bacterium]|nr:hypothetical protein [Bryobacteraceae bacterium]